MPGEGDGLFLSPKSPPCYRKCTELRDTGNIAQASSTSSPTLKSWASHSLLSLSFPFVKCKVNHLFLRCQKRGSPFLQDHLFLIHRATPPVLGLSSSPSLTSSLQSRPPLPLPLTSYSPLFLPQISVSHHQGRLSISLYLPASAAPSCGYPGCSTGRHHPRSTQHHKEEDHGWKHWLPSWECLKGAHKPSGPWKVKTVGSFSSWE